MPTINCARKEKAAASDVKDYMFVIDRSGSVVTPGTPDTVRDFKIKVKPGYENIIQAITAATGTARTSNYPTEAEHVCTQQSVAANNAVIRKAATIAETVANAEGLWSVTFVLGLTLVGGNTVTGRNVTLTLESPFNGSVSNIS